MKKLKLDPVVAIYCVGLTWGLYGLFFPLYRLSDLFTAGALSALVYFLVKTFICKKPESLLKFERTGIAEADEIIKKGRVFIDTLDKLNIAIPDEILSNQIDKLKSIAIDIFTFIEKHPENTRQINSFMDYYFPTAIKMLDTYTELQGKGTGDGNIQDTISKIENIMDTIIVAFQKQLDVLYEDKNLDIRTDIEVLNAMLTRDGLV